MFALSNSDLESQQYHTVKTFFQLRDSESQIGRVTLPHARDNKPFSEWGGPSGCANT